MKLKLMLTALTLSTAFIHHVSYAAYPQFTWGPEFVSNEVEMDHEHQALFFTLSSLCDAFEKKNLEDTKRIFHGVVNWAVTHFASEEAHMQEIGYAHLEVHKKAHQDLVEKIQEVTPSVEAGTADGEGLMNFLHDWLYHHIPNADIPAYGKS